MSIEREIADLEAILNAGAKSVAVGSERTEFDLDQIRRRIRELKAQQSATRRPRVAQVDLGGF